MTHFECVDVLLGEMSASKDAAPDVRLGFAAEHVARCSDCWSRLNALWTVATGEALPEHGRMTGLFGCEPVREKLFLLATLDAETMARREPDAVRHLGWCHSCRDRLAELLVTEALAASGALDPVDEPAGPNWREVVSAAGRTVLELGGRLVVRLEAAMPTFEGIPAGLLALPEPAPAGLRGGAGERRESWVRRVRVDLDEARLDLTLHGRGGDRADLEVDVTAPRDVQSVRLLQRRPDGTTELVALQPIHAGEPVRVRAVAAGAYVLEVGGRAGPAVRIGLDVEAPPA